MKTCTKCREDKPLTAFYASATKCKQCHLSYMHEHYIKTREAYLERRRIRRAEDPSVNRRENLKRMYGISETDYQNMFDVQCGRCKLCARHVDNVRHRKGCTKLVVDHDHDTGKIRGLLCVDCNLMLGLARDSVAVLGAAIEYLQEFVS